MTYCKISLEDVPKSARRKDYRDGDYRRLFGSLGVIPVLPFDRKEFKRTSVKFTKGMSIPGVQQKLSLRLEPGNTLVPVTKGGEYIVKPSPEEFPNAAENEHAAMVISHLLGIKTASCGLMSFSDGELVYITKRFDRVTDHEKLHQEDMAQGFGEQSKGKYDKSYEETGRQIGIITNGKQAVILDFIQRVIFSYLIGNDDFHLKNISLQKTLDNTTRFYDYLTPNYDCLFAKIFTNSDSVGFLALDLLQEEAEGQFSRNFEHYGFYTAADFFELSKRLDIPKRPVEIFIEKILSKADHIFESVNHSYMPSEMKNDAIKLIQDRIRALSIKTN